MHESMCHNVINSTVFWLCRPLCVSAVFLSVPLVHKFAEPALWPVRTGQCVSDEVCHKLPSVLEVPVAHSRCDPETPPSV